MIKLLVTGANGQLGSELKSLADNSGLTFFFTDIGELDLTDNLAVTEFINANRPDYVINAAGYTAVDKAESEPYEAFMVNYTAVANIVGALASSGGKLVHISTDYIFDGDSDKPYPEDFPALPISVYGRSKLAGEEMATMLGKSVVIRTSWLYSSFGKNFVKTITRLSKSEKELKVVNDQVGSPTYAADLAATIINIVKNDAEKNIIFDGSIYNYCNTGICSWYDFALKITAFLGRSIPIIPISTSDLSQPAERPAYSVLDTSAIRKTYNIFIPDWKDSLRKCLSLIE